MRLLTVSFAAALFASALAGQKADDDARQEFVDLLELLPADDPAKAEWRRQLTSRLF